MEGSSGGTALVLVTMLLAQMQARGEVDLDQMEQGLRMLLDREIPAAQLADSANALTVIQNLKEIPTA